MTEVSGSPSGLGEGPKRSVLLEASGLEVKYPFEDRAILTGVDFSISEGEFVLVLGPSGAGKSTLALSLNGAIPKIIKADVSGTVRLVGESITEKPIHTISTTIGMILQDPDTQFATLQVDDEVAFALENLRIPPQEIIARRDAAIRRVGLEHKQHARLDRLSGGEKQRLAIASILVMEPRALVLDEPTANLDPIGARELFALLRGLKQDGVAIVIIEHRIDDIIEVVDRVVVINLEGRVVADGTPLEVFRSLSPEALHGLGVWVPEVVRLAFELKARGLDPGPLTLSPGDFARDLPPATMARLVEVTLPQVQAGTTAMEAPQIAVKDLTYRYADGTQALDQVSMEVEKGEFFAIAGVNGSGKTTLALTITGLLTPPPGTVEVDGRDASAMSVRDLARQFAYVFQNPEHQFVTDAVGDEVAYSLRLQNEDESAVKRTTDQLLGEFGLWEQRFANPFAISQGQKRRLSVASMLALGQRILILDEPTFGQDRKNADAIMERLVALRQDGRTIIMITHDMRLIAEYASRVLVLKRGKRTFLGAPSELFRDETLGDAGLDYPPIAAVSRALRMRDAAFPGLLSVPSFVRRL